MTTRSDRFGDDYEIVPEGLWEHSLTIALGSRHGQQMLRELRDALLALPEKRLILGELCFALRDEDDRLVQPQFCAIGAFAFRRRLAKGETEQSALEALTGGDDDQPWHTVFEGQRQGLRYTVAWHVAMMNDDFRGSDEDRYAHILQWVNAQLSKS
jgi:hypothetical protein